MKVTPDDYGRRCQFDHFCKLVLYHEAVDYFRERKRQRGWETSFETLPLSELDTLCTIDQYPSDSFIFPAYGCELQISDGLVAAAFASLPQPGQSILILHCVLELTDGEIGAVVGMSRSAVQRHRTKTLETMRTRLTGGIAECSRPDIRSLCPLHSGLAPDRESHNSSCLPDRHSFFPLPGKQTKLIIQRVLQCLPLINTFFSYA